MLEEFDFKLPKGLIDANGELHALGKMRLLTAKDELIVQDLSIRDRELREPPASLSATTRAAIFARLYIFSRAI